MDSGQSHDVTRLLKAWGAGDPDALEQLTPKVYQELRRMAGRYMKNEKPGNTLQATALVNEAFLKLVDSSGVDFHDRVHFFAVSAQIMRRILVDRARARLTEKRGGGGPKLNLDEVPQLSSKRDREVVAIDEALGTLAKLDPRKAKVIELRFFGGLSVEETAAALKISTQTVLRDWKLAKAWLMRELTRGAGA